MCKIVSGLYQLRWFKHEEQGNNGSMLFTLLCVRCVASQSFEWESPWPMILRPLLNGSRVRPHSECITFRARAIMVQIVLRCCCWKFAEHCPATPTTVQCVVLFITGDTLSEVAGASHHSVLPCSVFSSLGLPSSTSRGIYP